MYRVILVPVDGSPFSESALPLARLLARRSGASLHMVHVHLSFTGLPIYVEGLPVIDAELHSQAKTHEQAYLDGLRNRIAAEESFPVQVALLDTTIDTAATGTVPGVLASHARQIGADLVVMSTHGRGGLARAWLGSVADGLVRQSSVPLLLVRPADDAAPHPELTIRRMLIPLDGSELAEQALAPALALGDLLQADYHLVQVVEPLHLPGYSPIAYVERLDEQANQAVQAEAAAYLATVAQRLRTDGRNVHTHVLFSPQPAAALLVAAEQQYADVIALSTHGRRGVRRMLLGSVADKVVRGAHLPVLVFRPAEE